MGEVMLINGSPRAPRSNSKQYAELLARYCPPQTGYYEVKKTNHLALCQRMGEASHVVFVFPLYVDSIPVTLLDFLKVLEANGPEKKPIVSAVVNCGFIEPEQNDVAVEMLRYYCGRNGYPFGSALEIGGGEAILTTPFRLLVNRRMRQFAASIKSGRHRVFRVTMPISKKMFIRASTGYWENYGKKNGVSKEEMRAMEIE